MKKEERTKYKYSGVENTIFPHYWKIQLDIGTLNSKKNAVNNLFECIGSESIKELLKNELKNKEREIPVRILILSNLYELENKGEKQIVDEFIDILVDIVNDEEDIYLRNAAFTVLQKIYENRNDEKIFNIIKEKYTLLLPNKIFEELKSNEEKLIERENEIKMKETEIRIKLSKSIIAEKNSRKFFYLSLTTAATSTALAISSIIFLNSGIKNWKNIYLMQNKAYSIANEIKSIGSELKNVYDKINEQISQLSQLVNISEEKFVSFEEEIENIKFDLEKKEKEHQSLEEQIDKLKKDAQAIETNLERRMLEIENLKANIKKKNEGEIQKTKNILIKIKEKILKILECIFRKIKKQ